MSLKANGFCSDVHSDTHGREAAGATRRAWPARAHSTAGLPVTWRHGTPTTGATPDADTTRNHRACPMRPPKCLGDFSLSSSTSRQPNPANPAPERGRCTQPRAKVRARTPYPRPGPQPKFARRATAAASGRANAHGPCWGRRWPSAASSSSPPCGTVVAPSASSGVRGRRTTRRPWEGPAAPRSSSPRLTEPKL